MSTIHITDIQCQSSPSSAGSSFSALEAGVLAALLLSALLLGVALPLDFGASSSDSTAAYGNHGSVSNRTIDMIVATA